MFFVVFLFVFLQKHFRWTCTSKINQTGVMTTVGFTFTKSPCTTWFTSIFNIINFLRFDLQVIILMMKFRPDTSYAISYCNVFFGILFCQICCNGAICVVCAGICQNALSIFEALTRLLFQTSSFTVGERWCCFIQEFYLNWLTSEYFLDN